MQAEKTDAAIRWEGVNILTDALGPVDAERFIALMSRESFDYTKWRREHLPAGSVREISSAAAAYSQNMP